MNQSNQSSKSTTRPKIVCLCGSTRFSEAFQEANLKETLAGNIVLTVGCMTQSDQQLQSLITPEAKIRFDRLHLEKIKLADEVLILNVGGYVGYSTYREFLFALYLGKEIRFLEPDNIPLRCLNPNASFAVLLRSLLTRTG